MVTIAVDGPSTDFTSTNMVVDCVSNSQMVIEALSYRLSDHTTADDATRYRSNEEVQAAWKVEPLVRTRAYLQSRGILDEAREQAMKAEYAAEVEAAVKEYLDTPKQPIDSMFDYLYANPPRYIAGQKAIAKRYAGTGRPSH